MAPSPMTLVSSVLVEKEVDFKCETFSHMVSGALSSSPDASITVQNRPASSPGRIEESESPSESPIQSSMTSLPEEGTRSNTQDVVQETLSTASGSVSRRSNVARFKSMMPSRLPISRSSHLTIPPGLSPTTLLDSPVLLSTNQAEPSPTTGTFPLPPISQNNGKEFLTSDGVQKSSNEDIHASFTFERQPNINKIPPLPPPPSKQEVSPLECESTMESQALPIEPLPSAVPHPLPFSQELPKHVGSSPSFWNVPGPEVTASLERMNESPMKSELIVQPSARENPPVAERLAEDGYNWRKYGQKQVKGSEFPRSYYKCTYPNCSVRKKVERSYDGQVTEIVYKGEHGHPKPQSTRRSSMSTNGGWDGLSAVNHKGDNHIHINGASSRGHMGNVSNGTPEASLGSISDANGELNKAKDGDDDDDDEPDSKRARDEMTGDVMPLRTIREPRVIVQTISEVDILDDGYRWRKYGQKVVKGNPYPRSYYKCTNVDCSVRKHVERSSTNPGAVITTYEGKHNHEVPAARSSHHASTTASVSNINSIPTRTAVLQDKYPMHNAVQMGVQLGAAPMNLVMSGRRSSENLGHDLPSRPKEERIEDNIGSCPTTFLKSSSANGVTEQLAQGP